MATAFLLVHLHDKLLVVWNGKFRQAEHRLLRFLASHTHHISLKDAILDGKITNQPLQALAFIVEKAAQMGLTLNEAAYQIILSQKEVAEQALKSNNPENEEGTN